MSNNKGANRKLVHTLNNFFALARDIRASHLPSLAAAIESDDPARVDEAMDRMNEEANTLIATLGVLEGLVASCSFSLESDVAIEDNFKIEIKIFEDTSVMSTLSA